MVLAVSLPKGDRQRWLVEKAVELGVARLVPVVSSRSVAQPSEKAVERLRRAVVEASKQCGRNRLMEIDPARRWADVVRDTPPAAARWIAHPAVRSPMGTAPKGPSTVFSEIDLKGSDPVFLAVGPEGGFTEEEVALAVEHGWRPIDLGPRILRIETAALALAALVARQLDVPG